MVIHSIYDPEFRTFGRPVDAVPSELVAPIVEAMRAGIEVPDKTAYDTSLADLEGLAVADRLGALCFGDLPFQFGCVRGHNTKLNCLEYHRSSEFNVGTDDFILLLAHVWDIERDEAGAWTLDTAKVQAFRAPAGVLIEVFGTSMHYTPCHANADAGFRVLVALPRGTNEAVGGEAASLLDACAGAADAELLWAANKYLLAHPESAEAQQGAYVGLRGENWDIDALR